MLFERFDYFPCWKKNVSAQASLKESGFITIITVLLMLVITTMIGISAIGVSMTESSIVRNDTLYKRNFYYAESAGFEAAQRLENATLTDEDPTGGIDWIIAENKDLTKRDTWWNKAGTPNDYSDDSWVANNSVHSDVFYTDNPGVDPSNLDILLPGSHTADDIRLAAHFRGVAAGSSLKVTTASGRLYSFNTYGMFSNMAAAQGESLIEMGYRKRF